MNSNSERVQPIPPSFRAPWHGPRVDLIGDGDSSLITDPEPIVRKLKDVLFVHPDLRVQQTAHAVLQDVASLTVCSTFADARAQLSEKAPDLLVTGIRLQAHNGVHLAYLAAQQRRSIRCVVFAGDEDRALARDVLAANAFFVRTQWLEIALRSYVTATLPLRDRRNPDVTDRRRERRGGRRSTDR
jgi:DNA-binding NtrC family response regulator